MSLDLAKVTAFVESHIGEFHDKRLASIDSLKLEKLLLRHREGDNARIPILFAPSIWSYRKT